MASKLAIVTGGNKGMGKAFVKAFAAYSKVPTTIYLACRDPELGEAAAAEITRENAAQSKKRVNPAEIKVHQLDISDKASMDRFVSDLSSSGRKIDLLVHNAARYIKSIPMDKDERLRVLDVNFIGTVYLNEALFPFMNRNSRVVFISSKMGVLSNYPPETRAKFGSKNLTLEELKALQEEYISSVRNDTLEQDGYLANGYSVSKTFLTAYTKNLPINNAADTRNIFYACCHPGVVHTDMGGPNNPLTPEEGIITAMYLSTEKIENLGPNGSYYDLKQVCPQ